MDTGRFRLGIAAVSAWILRDNWLMGLASWGGLFFLSLYLAGKMHLFDNRGEVWKVFIVMVPSLGAALVAISRIEDARHHPFDVITGSLLGALCAYIAYRQYFPSLSESWKKGRAYPIRSWGTGPTGPDHAQAEREFARDKGREPLRSAPLPQTEFGNVHDTEYDPPNQRAPNAARLDDSREQLAPVERLRSHSAHSVAVSSLYTSPDASYANRLPSTGSVPSFAGGHLRYQRGTDEYWDGTSDEDVREDIELQPRHELPARYPSRSAGAHVAVATQLV